LPESVGFWTDEIATEVSEFTVCVSEV
jgi:hypothetical protein